MQFKPVREVSSRMTFSLLSLVVLCLSACTTTQKEGSSYDPQGSLSSESVVAPDNFSELVEETLGDDKLDSEEFGPLGLFEDTLKDVAARQLAGVPEPEPPPVPAIAPDIKEEIVSTNEPLMKLDTLEKSDLQLSKSNDTPLIFDFPVTYNDRVRAWIRYFQTSGRQTFKTWLERSSRFLPILQSELADAGLPRDLAYVAMIESGFSSSAVSHAGAMGMWQFIQPTAVRYKLRVDWWIDERKDFFKATQAAIRYMTDLNRQFDSWYLVAASYNMGENGVRRLIKKYNSHNFWELAEIGALPRETSDYVPKIIAATLISKAPALYGFRDLNYQLPPAFESIMVPGGTDIISLASYLGVSEKYLKELNPELLKGFVPSNVQRHKIRIPKGSMLAVSQYIQTQARNEGIEFQQAY